MRRGYCRPIKPFRSLRPTCEIQWRVLQLPAQQIIQQNSELFENDSSFSKCLKQIIINNCSLVNLRDRSISPINLLWIWSNHQQQWSAPDVAQRWSLQTVEWDKEWWVLHHADTRVKIWPVKKDQESHQCPLHFRLEMNLLCS